MEEQPNRTRNVHIAFHWVAGVVIFLGLIWLADVVKHRDELQKTVDGYRLYSSSLQSQLDTANARLQRIDAIVAKYNAESNAAQATASLPSSYSTSSYQSSYTPSTDTGVSSYRGTASYNSINGHPAVAENGSYYGQTSTATGNPKTTYVHSYTRGDGTYVRAHYRSHQ